MTTLPGYDNWKGQEPPYYNNVVDYEKAHEAAESEAFKNIVRNAVYALKHAQRKYVADYRAALPSHIEENLTPSDCENEAVRMAIEELEHHEKAQS